MGSLIDSTDSSTSFEVIDIRRGEIKLGILDEIKSNLHAAKGAEKQLPTILLYDQIGLKLFEEITFLPEYYLTNSEIDILDRYADRIADTIPSGSQLIELGSGNLRKISVLLQALDRSGKKVEYYALDLSRPELVRTLHAVSPNTFRHVKCRGLYGTYDDGLEWLKRPENRARSTVILSMGSSIGNFERSAAASFLRNFSQVLKPTDLVLVGVDGCLERNKVFQAYNDHQGLTHEFYRNGVVHANRLLGYELFKSEDWEIIGEFEERQLRHSAFVSSKRNVTCGSYSFKAGERIRIERAYKYSSKQRAVLWRSAGLALRRSYSTDGEYSLNILSPPPMAFSLDSLVYTKQRTPSLEELEELWTTWDLVSLKMLPREEILSKPIHLRNCCIFYLGHIPNFLDVQLTRANGEKLTEPSYFKDIFERGIDPDVENPEKCHAHSKIPDSWPSVNEILGYRDAVRHRVRSLYKSQAYDKNPKIGKAIWLGLEHEAMHLETLLYMLLQSDKTLPPPGPRPDFEALARMARSRTSPNLWVKIPGRVITVGKDEGDDFWGWDNEFPLRSCTVKAFEARSRPMTNGDYARFLIESNSTDFPTSWITDTSVSSGEANYERHGLMNGYSGSSMEQFLRSKSVRTVYGPVPLVYALDWPVQGSYDQLFLLAEWEGCRIPTFEEARSIYACADELKAEETDNEDESPTGLPLTQQTLFADLQGCNVGFENFHPMPVTLQGDKIAGLCGMGGVWEWTSSPLERWDGFKPMEEYPAYTADFFDGKHNICLGGSWATHPRIAGRRSFLNWYQRSYPYAWIGARLVRDLPAASTSVSQPAANSSS